MSQILHAFDAKVLPKDGWLRSSVISITVGTGLLYCVRYLLSLRRAYCTTTNTLTGKTCIVTGANCGIGKSVAIELAKRNSHVILACRDLNKAKQVALEVQNCSKNSKVSVYQLDLASFASIREFVHQINENEKKIDILINNAGLMCCPFAKSTDGIEMHFAVNHLGHFLLTNLLIDKMTHDDSRIIVVSSSLHKKATLDLVNFNDAVDYNPMLAYARSKLANILFTHQLAKKLPKGITVNAMHPGMVWTNLGRYRLVNMISKSLFGVFAYFFIRSPYQGAQTIIHMATEPSLKGVTGKYFGDCVIEQTADLTKNDKLAEKLWELSERISNLEK